MDNIQRQILKVKIVSLKGTAFQDAVDRIFLCIYGQSGYERVKQKKDAGSDGILDGTTVLAVYSPEIYTLSKFKTKISEDFKSYKNNWEATHGCWQVVTNLESTAQMIKFVKSLKANTPIICIESLLQIISQQTWTVKLSIFRSLDIPEIYLSNNVISTIIEDLIQVSEKGTIFKPYEKPAYITDKVDLNLSEENKELFLEEYEEALEYFPIIADVIGAREQANVAAVRNKIRSTYLSLSGSFENKLNELVDILAQDKLADDFYKLNMRIVMVYFFEQCLFGKKPSSEGLNV